MYALRESHRDTSRAYRHLFTIASNTENATYTGVNGWAQWSDLCERWTPGKIDDDRIEALGEQYRRIPKHTCTFLEFLIIKGVGECAC